MSNVLEINYLISSYLILSYLMLCYLILSYLMLSYLILFYVILFYLMLSYLILSYDILSYLILSYVILSYNVYYVLQHTGHLDIRSETNNSESPILLLLETGHILYSSSSMARNLTTSSLSSLYISRNPHLRSVIYDSNKHCLSFKPGSKINNIFFTNISDCAM